MAFFCTQFLSSSGALTVPFQRVFVKCEPDPKCDRLANQFLPRQLARAAFDAGTNVSLSGKQAEAAEVVTELEAEMSAADSLCPPPAGPPL